MSLSMKVYVKEISDEIIPKLIAELNKFEMHCEVHPDFSFATQTGFLPFKFRLTNPKFSSLLDRDLLSGFELDTNEFDFQAEKEKVQPKMGFAQKIFSKKPAEVPLHSIEIDNKLNDCKKELNFVWHVGDSFELRFALLSSAIISRLTNGVCWYDADNIWYDNQTIVEDSWKEIKSYEDSINEKDIQYHLFESWN